jgi:hypothetical protein
VDQLAFGVNNDIVFIDPEKERERDIVEEKWSA